MNSAASRVSDVLRLRIQSALVLIVAAVAAVWFGSPWVALIVAFAGLAMGWEWGRLTAGGEFGPRAAIAMATALLAVGIAASGRFVPALIVAVVGGIAIAAARARDRMLAALGTAWIAGGCIAFLWLADPRIGGRVTIFFLLLIVWLTDIFAYFVGRSVGGPRLAAALSPNKTWAGFAGGLTGAAIAGALTSAATGSPYGAAIAIGLVLSLIAQAGDLVESWAKRHFAVKDASGLIPGHGGVLDRLDGLMAAAIAAALIRVAFGAGVLVIR